LPKHTGCFKLQPVDAGNDHGKTTPGNRIIVEGELCGNNGAMIPFAATREERLKTGDPRLSLAERYPPRRSQLGDCEGRTATRTRQAAAARRRKTAHSHRHLALPNSD
jgi:hypothetical protein